MNLVPTKATVTIARRMVEQTADNGALCAGQWRLFDSTDEADHREAARLCAVGTDHACPMLTECRRRLDDAQRKERWGGPQGTWAGLLVRGDRVTDVLTCGLCGTEFRPSRHRFRYCSDACSRIARTANHKRSQDKRAMRIGEKRKVA